MWSDVVISHTGTRYGHLRRLPLSPSTYKYKYKIVSHGVPMENFTFITPWNTMGYETGVIAATSW